MANPSIHFQDLPKEIRINIARLVGSSGFLNLGPLIASGKDGMEIALSKDVLKFLPLQEFMVKLSLVNWGSIYTPFFAKCLECRNPVAQYLESIRIVSKWSHIEEAIRLLEIVEPESSHSEFARGLFLICGGSYYCGMAAILTLQAKLGSFEKLCHVAEDVVRHYKDMEPVKLPVMRRYWWFKAVPDCVYVLCRADNRCHNCFIFWLALEILEITSSDDDWYN